MQRLLALDQRKYTNINIISSKKTLLLIIGEILMINELKISTYLYLPRRNKMQ